MAAALDLSEFEALGQRSRREPCKVGLALAELKPADRRKVDAAIRSESPKIRRGALRWLVARGLKMVSAPSIASHRQGTCSCNG